ncbi:MAG: hypothetical protein ACXWRU_19360 [Pseudobdellovibrionaceae bacterium]
MKLEKTTISLFTALLFCGLHSQAFSPPKYSSVTKNQDGSSTFWNPTYYDPNIGVVGVEAYSVSPGFNGGVCVYLGKKVTLAFDFYRDEDGAYINYDRVAQLDENGAPASIAQGYAVEFITCK